MNWLARAFLAFALLVASAPTALPVAAKDASMHMPDCDDCEADSIDNGVCVSGCFAGLVAIVPPAVGVSMPLRAKIEAVAVTRPASHARLPEPRPPNAIADRFPVA